MVKVIHSADMHLDAPMNSSSRHKSELLEDFKALIDLANQKEADILLISGDLFDSPFPTDDCVREAVEILGTCKSNVFISPGNHDYYQKDSVYHKYCFPDNVHIFISPEIKCVSTDCGADIYGYAFTSGAKKRQPLCRVHNPDRINIFSIHGDLGVPESNYAPLSCADIEMTEADYVALGHIHKSSHVKKAGKTSYAYCGCLSAKDFGESGQKGVIFGIFEKSHGICHSHFEFLPLSTHRYEIVNINITDISTMTELYNKLTRIISREEFGKHTSLRLVFKGERSEGIILSQTALDEIADKVFELEIDDRTLPKLSEQALENDPTVRGELYNILKDKLGGSTEEAELARLALRMALGAINNEDISELTKGEDIDV